MTPQARLHRSIVMIWLLGAGASHAVGQPAREVAPLRFEVTLGEGAQPSASRGRLFVVLGRTAGREPRLDLGQTGKDATAALAADADFAAGAVATVDGRAASFPLESLADLPPGDYWVQALFDSNHDLKSPNAPGNLYSEARRVRVDPRVRTPIRLSLTHRIPAETLPPDSELVRFVRLRSELLSEFHGRPIFLRAGVILPPSHGTEPARRYPLRIRIGGYGARFTRVQQLMAPGSEFRAAWLDPGAPQMILLHLDGDGPLGDPYQVNSANHGPFGDAVTRELVPHVERTYRAIGEPHARVLDGGSTGGWVSLALQIFYPDFFNGAWSYCPDSVDFRAFQLVDIYGDENAYVNGRGFERPSAREVDGDVRFTMRHECQMENLLGHGDSWTMSGQQWGAWNATYGPRGDDGRPVPLWDPITGRIDRAVTEHWKAYDLRRVLERDWEALGPKLHGKLRIWIGEADNYFLDNAVHLLDDFLSIATPPYGGSIVYGSGEGHCWVPLSPREVMSQMAEAVEGQGTPH